MSTSTDKYVKLSQLQSALLATKKYSDNLATTVTAGLEAKINNIGSYKGSVATFDDLPTEGLKIGDNYNIETASELNGINAGDNVQWTGVGWDVMAGKTDLSAYSTTAQIQEALNRAFNEISGGDTGGDTGSGDNSGENDGGDESDDNIATDEEVGDIIGDIFG